MCLDGVGFHCLFGVLGFGAVAFVLPGTCAGERAYEH